MSVIVYRYGVHYQWAPPDELREQLRLAYDLREDLVTLQLDHEQRVKDVWSSYPQVAAAEVALAAAEERAEQAAAVVSAERQRQRTKRVTGPSAEALSAARKVVREARQARRDAIAGVREEAKARLNGLSADLNAAAKALYADYVQTRGLYWATYNDVVDHHRTAVRRVAADRAAGRPATLRHHRWDGSGTIAVQLQRGAGMPPRTPSTLADTETGRWRNVLALPWVGPDEWDAMSRAEQRHAGRITVRMRCGAGHIEVPVQAHRMLPADADVTGARLTVRRVASRQEVSLSITARVADPEPVTDGPVVAIHLGWRDDDGETVVAHWRASAPLSIPLDLRHVFALDAGSRVNGTIRVPARIAARLAAVDALAAERALALDVVRAELVAWLEAGPVPHPTRDGEEITAADVARWRSPARFAVLALAWRDAPPDERIGHLLEDWRRGDKAAWERQENGRRKVLAHRDDLVRQIAAVISDQAGALVIDDMSIASIAARASDLPTDVETSIAHRRTVAAPGALRAAIVAACTRDGVGVITVDASGLSRVHAGCGHENPSDDRYMSRPVRCEGCGVDYDPDRSATVIMLARAVSPGDGHAGSARAS